MKARRNMRKGLSLLLSLVMLFSLSVPAGMGAEPLPDLDAPSAVTDSVYDSDIPPVADELLDLENSSVTEAVYTWGDYAADSFAGGVGSDDEPYQIADGGQLAYLAQLVNSGVEDTVSGETYAEKAYILIGDIDLSPHPWAPIGQENGLKFAGSFDGANKTISGLHVAETTGYVGLFGVIGAGGSVKNLTLSGAGVNGKNYVGAVAGKIEAAVIENAHLINSSITATSSFSGGLVGKAEGTFIINSCTVAASIITSSGSYIGGILGCADKTGGVVSSCTVLNSQVETSKNSAGGICGCMNDGWEVSRCSFTGGSVSGKGYVGGIAGQSGSSEDAVYECYVDADITASESYAGGIAGNFKLPASVVLNCYAKGSVTASSVSAAGIANGGTIKNCYSTAIVHAAEFSGGIVTNGNVATSVALNSSVTETKVSSGEIGRVLSKSSSGSCEMSQNCAFEGIPVFRGGKLLYVPAAARIGNLKDGKDITYAELTGDSSPFADSPLSWDGGVWNLEAGKLPTLKNLPNSVAQSNDLPDHLSGGIDWIIKAFGYLTNSIEVDNGTTEENIGLPAELEATLANGNQSALIPVTWSSSPDYDGATPGVYAFTAVLPGNCVLKSGVEAPVITVTVKDNYRVTFDSRGGSEIAPVCDVLKGSTIGQPDDPVRESFIFGGWYKDEACTQAWDFAADTVTSSITLYAKWSIDGDPDYTATQPGVQSVDVSGMGFADTAIVSIAHIDGYTTYAVVTGQKIDFYGPAGAYVLADSGMTIGSVRIGSFDQNPGNTPWEKNYKGTGIAEDPYTMVGAFYTKDGLAGSIVPLIGSTFRIWNLIAGYETEGKTYLGTPFSLMVEDRDMSTGRLNASFFIDGSELLPSNADGWFRSPRDFGVALNPSDTIITNGFKSHSLYLEGTYPERLAAATDALQAVRADSKKVLMYHTYARDFPGPVTHKLDVSGYFNEKDTVHINYLLGAANRGLYHASEIKATANDAYFMALEPIYFKNNTSAVVTDGYITFDLYNGGYFELVKAQDDDSPQDPRQVAEFMTDGAHSDRIPPQLVAPGAKVTKPADPVREGYVFGGWYTDYDCTAPFNFEESLTQHVILYAKWTDGGGPGPGPGETYTVTFVTGNDPDTGNPNATIKEQSVKSGNEAKDPGFFDSGYGYLVLAWYTDKELTREYDFDSEVTSNLTLYPEWMRYILKNDLKQDGGCGSQNDPYQAHLANSKQSKIAWKALNEISGESEWWKVYVTKNNNSGGKELYSWVFNGEDIEKCNTAQPYYTDIALSKRSGGMQAKFVWRTAIEGKVYVNINVSDYFDDGTAVAISYVEGSCDGRVAHTDVESGEWVDSLHYPSTYYSGGSAVVENDFVTLELTHGGTYLLKADENAQNNEKVGTAVEDPETGLVYIDAAVEAKDGVATLAISDEAIEAVIKALIEKNEDEIVIVPTITGEVSKINIELTGVAVAGIIEKITAALVLKTDIANVTVSNDILAKITAKEDEKDAKDKKDKKDAKDKEDEKVTFTIEKIAADTVKFEIRLNDEVIDISGGIRLAVPVEGAGDGMVAVLVKADGSEETIKKSVVNEGQLLTVLNGTGTIKFVDRSRSFDDVDDSFWGRDAIAFATSHELFSGVSETEFAPNTAMTRGMLVSVLHRLAGTPDGGDIDYADVAEDAWYAEPVAWASANGIVSGTGRNFEPGKNVTREEIAAMMYQYAKLVGVDTLVQGDTAQYSDADQISGWAADGVSWAVGSGLLKGKDGDALDPRGEASRAEVAAMMQRLVNKTMI
ncbi:InlB B-repeat-containing protein [Desulfoscipio sp. XC116]|uniref:InlB B-repeat-containing protein n=1 Tax=Desulfoscipio sp. XC116 TaxID=3144975 RepID=UPI00325B74FE